MRQPTFINLAEAHLCSDCEAVGDSADRCPRCQSRALIAITRAIHRHRDSIRLVCEPTPEELVQRAVRGPVRLPEINFRGSTVMVTFLLCVFSAAQNTHRASAPSTNGNDHRLIARGKYIVDDVAVCSQCHTPRDPQGNPDHDKWLEGAPVWFQPVQPNEDWPLQAPRIAGTPPGTDAEMITLLTTGIWSNGKRLRPPMPQFRLSIQDAQAVVAYLKSLTPKH